MRIAGITIPDNKRLKVGLTVLYGVGRSLSRKILKDAKVNEDKKPTEITPEEEAKIRQIVESRKIEGDLKREVGANIKRLKDIKSYRGLRHMRKLPSRGQRTKTNSRTLRGNTRKTMGTGRKAPDKK
jgi:small subunit ribosomal protein S13